MSCTFWKLRKKQKKKSDAAVNALQEKESETKPLETEKKPVRRKKGGR